MAVMAINSGNDSLSSSKLFARLESKSQGETRSRQLPVTLLSGFLGSGKTTLLQHILRSREHGYRIAVIVNDMSKLNIDAALVTQHQVSETKEKLIQLQNGCICCTLRGDLLSEISKLAKLREVDYVVIESTGIAEPQQVAETFTPEFTSAMIEAGEDMIQDEESKKILEEIAKLGGLHNVARLDTTVTVIDAFNLLSNFDTTEFLSDRYGSKETIPTDERTISDLMTDQIEFADVVVLNKVETVDEATKNKIRELIKLLNPDAKVLECSYSKIDVKEILGTAKFDFFKAASGAGWLRSLHEMTVLQTGVGNRLAPKPETLEYGINNFVYTARRPFHPRRLFGLLHDKFIVLQNKEIGDEDEEEEEEEEGEEEEAEGNDEKLGLGDDNKDDSDRESEEDAEIEDFDQPDPTVILSNKRAHPAFSPILRSKGFFWLATRPFQRGEWSQAGGMLTLGCGGPWFAEVPKDMWSEDPGVVQSIENDFQEPWGDRRQEIVFIGLGIKTDLVTKLLDECLLDESDMARWEKVMKNNKISHELKAKSLTKMWEDGWEEWPPFTMDDMDVQVEEEEEVVKDKARPKRKISEQLEDGENYSDSQRDRTRIDREQIVQAKAVAA